LWVKIFIIFNSFLKRLSVGVAGSGLALADAQRGAEVFVRLLTIEIFSSALGLFGIIVGLIMATNA